MDMIPKRRTASKPATRPHDPDVCGIDPASDCDTCRTVRDRNERQRYEQDAEAHKRAHLRAMAERIAEMTGMPLSDLAAVLLPDLAEGMAEVVTAVLDGRGTP